MTTTIRSRFTAIIAMIMLLIGVSACGNNAASAKPANLTGSWSETTKGKMKQTATITGSTITVNWHQDGEDMLYWKGTYEKPKKAGDWTWTSKGDTTAMESSLLASTDKTKKFTYSGGKIHYKVTAMGATVDVELSRVKK